MSKVSTDKLGHVAIMLLTQDGQPIIVSQPIDGKMEKRIWKLMRDVLPETAPCTCNGTARE